jgi:glycine hydroxymethyltransferase
LKREAQRKNIVIRFRFIEKGVRMAHSGDPVIDKKGKVIGVVTSCAVDSEGFLTGQAYLEEKSNEVGNNIFIYQGSPSSIGKQPNELLTGDRIKLPSTAQIISRFPK